MIKKFNQQQIIFGCLRGLLSLVLFVFTYAFFSFITSFFAVNFGFDVPQKVVVAIASFCVLAVAISGFRRWKNGQGHFTMAEASIPDNTDTNLFSRNIAQQDLTSNATAIYLLTTLFLAAPIQLLKAYDHFQALIPLDDALENRMLNLLSQLQGLNKWQNFNAHAGAERELIFLIKMSKVQYSPTKGTIKAS